MASKDKNKGPDIKSDSKLDRQKIASKNVNKIDNNLKIGDYITLLFIGVRNKKGDKAGFTNTKDKTVHFVVIRNGHSTHCKKNNVRKIE